MTMQYIGPYFAHQCSGVRCTVTLRRSAPVAAFSCKPRHAALKLKKQPSSGQRAKVLKRRFGTDWNDTAHNVRLLREKRKWRFSAHRVTLVRPTRVDTFSESEASSF